MHVTYRRTKSLPRNEVLRLYRSVGWSAASKPTRLMNALEKSHTVITAWADGSLVGLGNAITDEGLVVYYPHLLVAPAYQRQGIGRNDRWYRLMSRYQGFHRAHAGSRGKGRAILSALRVCARWQGQSRCGYSTAASTIDKARATYRKKKGRCFERPLIQLRRRSGLLRLQCQFLHAPVQQLGDVEHVLRRAGDLVDPAELLQLLARTRRARRAPCRRATACRCGPGYASDVYSTWFGPGVMQIAHGAPGAA